MENLTHTGRRLLRQPILWALVYGAMSAYGAYALWRIPFEVLPRFNFPQIRVIAHEPGASAAELETRIASPLEGEILALPNLMDVRSTMGNGTVETDARFVEGADPQSDLQAVFGAIDRAAKQIPVSVHPYAEIMGDAINEVADYNAQIPSTAAPAEVQRAILANVAPALRALPGVQRVELYGAGDEALWVQPNVAAMVRYRIPVTAIMQALQDDVLLRPGGYVTQGHQDVFIEARSLPTHIAQLERIPVVGANGPIPLGDLAHIVRAAVPTMNAVLLDRRPSVALAVFKQPGASTQPVTRAVQATLRDTLPLLPPGVRWAKIYDQGRLVHAVESDLSRNLIVGGLLAVLVMFWVLGAGRAIWILAFSIPLSLLLGVAGLYAAGQSLNLMTLGALTVAVGLLADDGILVLESIYHRWEQGDAPWPGIAQGLRDIAGPDVSGTLTTVSVFAPLLFVGGLGGLFSFPFALAMSLALLASLGVSLSLIPLGLGFVKARPRATPTAAARTLERLRRWNERLFLAVLRHPRFSLIVSIALLPASLAALALAPIDVLPLPNEGVLLESFSLPPGSSMLDAEAATMEMTRRMHKDPAVAHTFVRIGSPSDGAYTEPAYAGEIQIQLKPDIDANSLDRVGSRLLAESQLMGVQTSLDTPTIERAGESLSGLPQPFVVDLFGGDIGRLRTLAGQVTAYLRRIPALSGVFDNDGYPITQLQLEFKPEALAAQGMTPAQVYGQIAPLLNGEVAAQVPEGSLPLDLYVRLADAPDRSLAALNLLPIRTSGWTPLGQLASLRMTATPNQIRHIEGARALEILATPTGPLGAAIASARQALAGVRLPRGYRISFGGLYPQLEQEALGLGLAACAAFLLMAGIMILQFDGVLAPGLLLLQIPLTFTGGAFALVLSGVGLNAMGMIALLTLVGIGLNHGIVLLHRARHNESSGMPLEEAVRDAIQVRFRPIALTTLTAVLGMLPTALGWGRGAAPEQGLAIVILGGILWSALLSTNLLPALYLHNRQKRISRIGAA